MPSQSIQGEAARRVPAVGLGIILLLILVGTVLRFHGIGSFSLWEDELFSVATATQSGPWYGPLVPGKTMEQLQLTDSFWTWRLADPHPPLFDMLLVPWIALFGVSDFAIRSISAVFGVVTMLSVFALPRSIVWQPRAVYVALLAASGGLLIYSQDVRGYSLGACLSAWMFACMLRQMEQDAAGIRGGRPWIPLLVLGGLLGLTHYYGLVMVASIAAIMTLQVRSKRAFLRASVRWFLAVVPVLIYMGLGWMGIMMKLNAAPPKALSWAMTFKRNTLESLRNVDPSKVVSNAGFWIFILLAVVGVVIFLRMRRQQHRLAPAVGALAAVMALFYLVLVLATRRAEFFSPRYVIFMVPGCLLLVAMFTTVRGWPRLVSMLVALVLLPLGIQVWQNSPRPQNGGNWRGAADLVASNFRPGDIIVVPMYDPTMRSHFQHYLRNHIPQDQLDQRLLSIFKPEEIPARIAALGPTPPRVIVFSHYVFMSKFKSAVEELKTVGCRPGDVQWVGALLVEVMPCEP